MLLVLAAGCATARDPEIRVAHVRVDEITRDAALVRIGMVLRNDNDEPLELLEFGYAVDLAGRRVFEGVRAAQITLARRSEREFEIPAVIRMADMGWDQSPPPAEVRGRVHGTLRYLLPGTLSQTLFDTGIRRPRAGFGEEITLRRDNMAAEQVRADLDPLHDR